MQKNSDGCKLQRQDFLKLFTMDPNNRGNQVDATIDRLWRKPKSVSIPDHRNQFVWLLYYLENLQGSLTQKFTTEQRKKYYFKLFPNEWQKKFTLSRKVFKDTNKMKINKYMNLLKKGADKDGKENKK